MNKDTYELVTSTGKLADLLEERVDLYLEQVDLQERIFRNKKKIKAASDLFRKKGKEYFNVTG